jgi:hypothetical protein
MFSAATSYEAATAGASAAASVALVGLIILLVVKVICSAGVNPRLKDFSRNLDIAVAPLFIVFVAVFAAKIQSSL